MPTIQGSVSKLSSAAAWLSLACGIHCLATPLLIGFLPALEHWLGETVENYLLIASIAIGSLGIGSGYREHRRRLVLVLLAGAVVLIGVGRLLVAPPYENAFIIGGAALLACGQFLNLRFHRSGCRRCRSAPAAAAAPGLPGAPS